MATQPTHAGGQWSDNGGSIAVREVGRSSLHPQLVRAIEYALDARCQLSTPSLAAAAQLLAGLRGTAWDERLDVNIGAGGSVDVLAAVRGVSAEIHIPADSMSYDLFIEGSPARSGEWTEVSVPRVVMILGNAAA